MLALDEGVSLGLGGGEEGDAEEEAISESEKMPKSRFDFRFSFFDSFDSN